MIKTVNDLHDFICGTIEYTPVKVRLSNGQLIAVYDILHGQDKHGDDCLILDTTKPRR